jgi:hypothetical protein
MLALRRTAGNRAARAAITRSTSARILARKTVKEEGEDMAMKLGDPKNQPHSAALRKEAIAVADKPYTAYTNSKSDDDLAGCTRVIRAAAATRPRTRSTSPNRRPTRMSRAPFSPTFRSARPRSASRTSFAPTSPHACARIRCSNDAGRSRPRAEP